MKKYLGLFFLTISIYAQSETTLVEGFVFDEKSNERLSGVFISASDSNVAVTNDDGYFSFKVMANDFAISATMIGYLKSTKFVKIINNESKTKLFFRLTIQPIEITQVTVTGEQFKEKVKYKTYELQQGDLRNIPQIGEPDALRALQVLPGVTSLNDFSTQLYVRGGNFDETLIALDDVPLYNPYHFGGFFSIFNSDIIEKQVIYPSNYPSKYGGYLSGALNIKTKFGAREKLKGSASVGLISSKGYIESPIGNGSLVISARRTYLDILGALISKSAFPYYFYDLYAKYTYPLDDRNLLTISGFYSKDIFEIFNDDYYSNSKVETQPNWGNNIFSIDYSYLYDETNSIDVKLYRSSSIMTASGESLYESVNSYVTNLIVNNNVVDFTGLIKVNHSFTGHHFEVGLEYKSIDLKYKWNIGRSELSSFGFDLQETFFDFAPPHYLDNSNVESISYFISDKIQFSKSFSINLGLRASYLKYLKLNFISPSLNLDYNFNDKIELLFNYSRYFQNMFVIKDQNSVLLDPFSVYFIPQNENQLANSNNFSATVFLREIFFKSDIEINTYYSIRENLASSYSQDIDHYKFENGYSTSVELLIKKDFGFINGLISYSLSRSIKNNGAYNYFVRNDRTHSIKLLLNYNLSESWHLSSYWTFASGIPYTPTIGKYIGGEKPDLEDHEYDSNYFYWYPVEGNKNSIRTENYHRLDIGINGSFIWGKLFVKPYLQILNVYNNSNAIYYDQNVVRSTETKRASYIVPTIGLAVEF